MFVLVGLGNPGTEYQTTRHNVGFMLIDSIANDYNIPITQTKFNAHFGKGTIQNQDVLLVKPQTYVNLSGQSVQKILHYFKVPESNLIVLFDDLDLSHGTVKTRFGGGHGGHNGIRSLLEFLPSDKFYRIKIGIGKPAHKTATADWVLDKFNSNELNELIKDVFPIAKERILNILNKKIKNP